jgi:hypothetical protein
MASIQIAASQKHPDGSEPAAAGSLRETELQAMDAYWRASNYLSVGQIYLLDNPLLKEPLKRDHIKPRLLGHWGTSPGLNMLYVAPQSRHQARRPRHDLHHRPGTWRPLAGRARLSRGYL